MKPSSSSSLDLKTLKKSIIIKGQKTASKLHLLTKHGEFLSYKFLQDLHGYVLGSDLCEFLENGGIRFTKPVEFKRLFDGYKNEAGVLVPPSAEIRELLGDGSHNNFLNKIRLYNLKRVEKTDSYENEHFTHADPDLVQMVLDKLHPNESVVKREQRSEARKANQPASKEKAPSFTRKPVDPVSLLTGIVQVVPDKEKARASSSKATPSSALLDQFDSMEKHVENDQTGKASTFTASAPSTDRETASSSGAPGLFMDQISLLLDQFESLEKNVINSKVENEKMEKKLASMKELLLQLVPNVAGPSVGLSDKWMPEIIHRMLDKGIELWAPVLDFKRAVIDLPCTSVGYEMTASDMRLAVTGNSMALLMEYSKINVVQRSRLVDCVTKSGRLIVSMMEMFPAWETAEEAVLDEFFATSGFDLLSVDRFNYVDKFRRKALKALDLLMSGDEEQKKAWSKICDFNIRKFQSFYERLGMTVIQGRTSLYARDVIPFVDRLSIEGVLTKLEDGSLVIKTEGTAKPLAVVDDNQQHTFCVTDLVSIWHYLRGDRADWVIYVSSVDHSDYYASFFPAAKSLSFLGASEKQLYNVGVGLVLGEDWKESKLHSSDLIFGVKTRCRDTIDKRGETQHWSPEELEKYLEDLSLAVVKYAFLKLDSEANFTSSIEEMLNDKGDTAVALQHARSRICLAIEKSGLSEQQIQLLKLDGRMVLNSAEERELARCLLDFSEVIENACTSLKPTLVCKYLYKLSARVSAVYDIVRAEDSSSRLVLLLLATRMVMDRSFTLLGMDTLPNAVDQQLQ